MEEKDLSDFDKNVMKLFDTCKEILKTKEQRSVSLSNRRNPILSRLEKYIKTYTKSDPNDHVVYFEKVYESNKRFILLGPQRDAWLTDGDIIISFGEDCGLKTEMKLYLSAIYRDACEIRDDIIEENVGLPKSSEPRAVGLPREYICLLYRIFREIVISQNDKDKLTGHIQTLEEEMGIRSNKGNDALSGIFDAAANMAEQFSGKKIPKDKMPNQNDLGKMISSFMDNPQAKSMIGSAMQKFQNSKNIGDIIGGLTEELGDIANPKPENVDDEPKRIENAPEEEGDVNDEFDDY